MSDDSSDDSVVLFARKTLENNTRIFKQAKTLTEEGYDVTLIGIKPSHLPREEEQEGYTIVRVGKITPNLTRLRNVSKKLIPLYPVYIILKQFVLQFLSLLRFVSGAVGDALTWTTEALAGCRDSDRSAPRAAASWVYRTCRLASLQWFFKSRVIRVRNQLKRRLQLHRVRWAVQSRLVRTKNSLWRALGVPKIRWAVQSRYIRTRNTLWRRLNVAGVRWYLKSQLIRLRTRFRSPRTPQTSGVGRFRRLQAWGTRLVNSALDRILRRLLVHGRWFVMSYNFYTKSYRAMKERDLEPDVVQANDLNTLVVAIFAARRHDIPLCYDAQELYTEIHTLPRWYKYVLTVQEFVLIRFTDRVTVVNPFIAEVMENRYRTDIDDVLLNCPPFDPVEDVDARPGTTALRKFDIDTEAPVVLYSGGLSTQRGLENLVKAMADVPDAVLVILGEGSLREELEDMTVELGFADRVYFSDFVPHEEVPAFITSADIGVVPYEHVGMNHYLCSPSKLFHYIMAELVIVGSEFPFLQHVIKGDDIGGTFDPDNPESIAAAINAIVENPERLERHRENVAEAKYRYTWENEAEKFLDQYEAMHEDGPVGKPETTTTVQANDPIPQVAQD
jgi:glycosyltransferase involved in cell wall biosynthesis